MTIDKKKTDYENGLIEAHVPEEYREKCRIIERDFDNNTPIFKPTNLAGFFLCFAHS